ncbi:MAG: type II secretion system F family protein [Castellaniella sp.]
MDALNLDLVILLGLLLVIAMGGWILSLGNSRRARLDQRLQQATLAARKTLQTQQETSPRSGLTHAIIRGLQGAGRRLPLFDRSQRREMGGKLASAGFRNNTALALLIGLSGASALVAIFAIVTLAWPLMRDVNAGFRFLALITGGYIGMLVPRIVLDRLVVRRQQAIQRHFPDALDLLVVCTNAGLGLNAALQRVASELEHLAPALADELTLTSQQLELSGDMPGVLRQMADRINLNSIRSLVATLIQSRRFGTPIGHALRVLSQTERTARLLRTEEAAAKLATKITIPMMLFILPTVLMVGGGPAILQLMEIFANQ